MPKKESAKRGYITKEEVQEHLKDLKTDRGKVNYLTLVLKKEGLLSEETKKNVYRARGESYASLRDFYNASLDFYKIGDAKTAKRLNDYNLVHGSSYPEGLGAPISHKEIEHRSVLEDHKQDRKKFYRTFLKGESGELDKVMKRGYVFSPDDEKLLKEAASRAESAGERLDAARFYETLGDKENAARNYELANNPLKVKRLRREKQRDLDSLLSSIITIAGLGAGIFFLSFNITGNVIGNMTNSTSNIIGAALLVIGLVAGFFWLKSRKK